MNIKILMGMSSYFLSTLPQYNRMDIERFHAGKLYN